MSLIVPHNFHPRGYQRPVFEALERGVTRLLLAWHRRSGKDRTALAATATQMHERVGAYVYILPTYSQGRRTIWDALDREGRPFLDVFPAGIIADRNEVEQQVVLTNGSRLHVVGSDQIDRLMGVNFAGAVFSEFALQRPSAWDLLRPIAVEADAWVLFCSTPRGRNHFWQMYERARQDPAWFCSRQTVAETRRDAPGEDGSPVISGEEVDRERKEGMPDELIEQEFYCAFTTAMEGSYYGKLLDAAEAAGRIGTIPWNPGRPVTVALDIGYAESTACWFSQLAGPAGGWCLIDYEEVSGLALPDIIRVLRQKPYLYDQFVGPHDLAVTEFGSGQSRLEVARALGVDFTIAPKLSVAEGIDAVKRALPRMYIDRGKCARGLEALAAYRRTWNEATRMFSERPEHSWASHAADALRYLCVGAREVPTGPPAPIRVQTQFAIDGRQFGEPDRTYS